MNSNNKDLYVKIISIVSLAVLGYIFFISVYNQIIVQSGGVFYVIIFGGILILAFVLLSLVTKLIEITREIKDNVMWSFVEILLLCHLSYLFLVFRMAYKSTIPGEETVLYRAAALMREGVLSTKGMDLTDHLCIFPSQFLYSYILSVFFRIGGVKSSVMIVLNAVTLILTAFLIDRVVRKIAGRACGIIAAMCTLLIPSQAFAVYSYSSEVFFCALLLLSLDLWLILIEVDDNDKKKKMIFAGLFGLSLAFLCFVEPLMLLCAVACIVYYTVAGKKDGKYPMAVTGVICAVMIFLLAVLMFIKSVTLGTDIGTVFAGGMSRYELSVNPETGEEYTMSEVFESFHKNLDNQNTNVNDNYHFLVNEEGEAYTQTHNAWFALGTQMSYMFTLVMSIACAFYMFRNKFKNAIPVFIVLFSSFIVLFFRSTDEASTFFLFELLLITGACGLNYMYMNHHPELYGLAQGVVVKKETDNTPETATGGAMEWSAIARARKLIFVNDNDGHTPTIQEAPAVMQQPVQDMYAAAQTPAVPVIPTEPEPMTVPAPSEDSGSMMGGSVSPEGYFSFFNMGPAPTPAPAPTPMPAPIEQAAEEPEEDYFEEYNQPAEEYSHPEEEYSQPEAGYSEVVEDYSEDYSQSVEEYTEPAQEYTERAEEYAEPAEEYTESVEEYTEPVEEYTEPVEEYAEPAQDVSEPVYEEDGYDGGFGEPSFDELAKEYGQEIYEDTADTGVQAQEPVQAARTYDTTTKASYGSAAHALGFSLSDDFFDSVSRDEPEYEEADYTEPALESQPVEEAPYEEEPVQEYMQEPAPVAEYEQNNVEEPLEYSPTYEEGMDEFSFGEGMPDISMFEEPAPAPVPKKKVVRKVVRRVVKKVPAQKPVQQDTASSSQILPSMDFKTDLSGIEEVFEGRNETPEMQFKADLSSIEKAFSYEGDYVDDDAIYDEPADGQGSEGFVIEI